MTSDEYEEDWDRDEWVMDCGDPNCCMNFAPHFRSECYTPEMYEAYVEETTGGNQSGLPTDGDALRERTDDHDAGADLRGGSGVDTGSLEVGGEKRREDN
jgi:hypothetical protein